MEMTVFQVWPASIGEEEAEAEAKAGEDDASARQTQREVTISAATTSSTATYTGKLMPPASRGLAYHPSEIQETDSGSSGGGQHFRHESLYEAVLRLAPRHILEAASQLEKPFTYGN